MGGGKKQHDIPSFLQFARLPNVKYPMHVMLSTVMLIMVAQDFLVII